MCRILNPESSCPARPRCPAAYTLVELLITITIIAIVAGIVITRFEPSFYDQLRGTAQVVVSDLAIARSLAVANNSQYEINFDPAGGRYWLEHSGSVAALDTLPESPYRAPDDPPTRHTTELGRLPAAGGNVELLAVRNVSTSSESDATSVEFTELGSLAQSENCWIWLAVGTGAARRYLPVELSATTGLAKIGEFQTQGPVGLVSAAPESVANEGVTP
jgi:prepilin-type N-terminal cleavage/methylation domain-containing protein